MVGLKLHNWLHILIVNLSHSQTPAVRSPLCKTIRDVTWRFKCDLTSVKICHHQSEWWWLVLYHFVTPLHPSVIEDPTNYNCLVYSSEVNIADISCVSHSQDCEVWGLRFEVWVVRFEVCGVRRDVIRLMVRRVLSSPAQTGCVCLAAHWSGPHSRLSYCHLHQQQTISYYHTHTRLFIFILTIIDITATVIQQFNLFN